MAVWKSKDGSTIVHARKPQWGKTKSGQAYVKNKPKNILFPREGLGGAQKVINSPNINLLKLAETKKGNEFARKLVIDSLDTLNDNQAELEKQDAKKFRENKEQLEKALKHLSNTAYLLTDPVADEGEVKTEKPTEVEKEQIKKIRAKTLEELQSKDPQAFVEYIEEIAKSGDYVRFVDHIVQQQRSKQESPEYKRKLEETRKAIQMGDMYGGSIILSGEDEKKGGIDMNQTDLSESELNRITRLPRASMTPKEIANAKEREKLMKGMNETQKAQFLDGLQRNSPIIQDLSDDEKTAKKELTDRQARELIQHRFSEIAEGKFASAPEKVKATTLKSIELQLENTKDVIKSIDREEGTDPEKKKARKAKAVAKLSELAIKKRMVMGASDELLANLDKNVLREKVKQDSKILEDKIANRKEQKKKLDKELERAMKGHGVGGTKVNYKSEMLNNIALSQTSKSQMQLLAEKATKKREGGSEAELQTLEQQLQGIKDRDNRPRDQGAENQAVFGHKPTCSNCEGSGRTGNKPCKTCAGTGFSKLQHVIDASHKYDKDKKPYFCKECHKRGFLSPSCPSCHGRGQLSPKATLAHVSGRKYNETTEQATPSGQQGNPFGALATAQRDQRESMKMIQPPSRKLQPVTRMIGSRVGTVWVDKDGKTPEGINPATGTKFSDRRLFTSKSPILPDKAF